jgi:hypothetical protein
VGVLDERRGVVVEGIGELCGEAQESEVGGAVEFVPMLERVVGGGSGDEEGLGSVGGDGIDGECVVGEVVGDFADARVVEAGEGEVTGSERTPVVEVMEEEPVEAEVVLEEEEVIGWAGEEAGERAGGLADDAGGAVRGALRIDQRFEGEMGGVCGGEVGEGGVEGCGAFGATDDDDGE